MMKANEGLNRRRHFALGCVVVLITDIVFRKDEHENVFHCVYSSHNHRLVHKLRDCRHAGPLAVAGGAAHACHRGRGGGGGRLLCSFFCFASCGRQCRRTRSHRPQRPFRSGLHSSFDHVDAPLELIRKRRDPWLRFIGLRLRCVRRSLKSTSSMIQEHEYAVCDVGSYCETRHRSPST